MDLSQRHAIIETVSESKKGVVFKAQDRKIDSFVIVRVVYRTNPASFSFLRVIQSPHLARVIDLFASGNDTVNVFEYAAVKPGETTVCAQTKDGSVKSEEVKVTVKKLGDSSAGVSSQAPSQPKEPELAVSATDLLTAYDENGVNADNQYKGKYLKVTGTVGSVGTDILGDAYITLKNENNKYAIIRVQCYFDDNNTDAIASLKEGDSVSITGTCSGSTGNVILKDCDVVS